MSKPLVPDDLWEAIAPLLPEERPEPKGGRPRCDDRLALAGIIFVLRSGIPWEMLPREFGCSGMTCWRRLRDWQTAGVWTMLHRVLLERLSNAGHLDWSRASLDSAAVAAKRGGRDRPEPNGSRKTGHEAPSCGRPPGHPARGATEPGQPARQHDAGTHSGCRARRAPRSWTSAQAPWQAPRRQGLRPSPLPERMPETRHQAPHCQTARRQQRKTGPAPLGRRADTGMAEPLSPPRHPV